MILKDLAENKEMQKLNGITDAARGISGGICCDLLSWVMAKGRKGMAWVTVQSHMNVVAVAALHEFACIIVADGNAVPQDVLDKAEQEGIAVFGTRLSAYEVCCLMSRAGVG